MQLLFLDESGTHGGSPALIVAGVSVHEGHLAGLTKQLDQLMADSLSGYAVDPADFEFHAAEMKSPKPPKGSKKGSVWLAIPTNVRLRALEKAYELLGSARCGAEYHGCGLFGAVLDQRFHKKETVDQREQLAYETVLNKFDDSLSRDRREAHGLVIHDQRLVIEHDMRRWTREWQEAAGRVGQLERLALVPFFADSRGSRLLQAADLVAWALNRYYIQNDDRWVKHLWSQFDFVDGHMHGLIHLTPDYQSRRCPCPPCTRRKAGDLRPMPPPAPGVKR